MSGEGFQSPVDRPGLRVSDEDRERVISELGEHSAAGRLSTEELEDRLQAAYAARTRQELDSVRTDLPVGPRQAAAAHQERRRHLTRRMIQETGGSVSAFVVCTVIWLASGASGQFWPVWLLIVVAMSALRNGWTLYGPAADLDAVERNLDGSRHDREARRERRNRRRLGS